ncbi:hypothetical protein [Brevundimonas sp.]|uniref:hypothetical protein n=1 Tax=Brevundimonas sp. TaxID=1871086 RepID=UPI001A190400|nr:hypothetical protein [Brevundimonas sp.]MBJ7485267.1 hypothetical protein [Brevundimonas sp.]
MLDITRFRGAMAAGAGGLAERLARTTPRERLLLGSLVVAAIAYAPVAALDWRSSQEARYVDALTRRAEARAAQSQAAQLARDAQDAAVLEDMNSWGFTAGNVAVAQVALEQRILESATAAQLTNFRITTDTELQTIGPISWLGADVQADLRWGPTFAFLDGLAGWPEGFRVTSFSYELVNVPMITPLGTPSGPPASGRVTIGIAAPVEIADASGAPA